MTNTIQLNHLNLPPVIYVTGQDKASSLEVEKCLNTNDPWDL